MKYHFKIPRGLESCHTATVEGYVLEGHIPAEDVKRLLKEKPNIKGLAVPGMPGGSPGMESSPYQPYKVFAIGLDGKLEVFATH